MSKRSTRRTAGTSSVRSLLVLMLVSALVGVGGSSLAGATTGATCGGQAATIVGTAGERCSPARPART